MEPTLTDSQIKDPSLAEQGLKNLALAESCMPALMKVRERFAKERPFEGMRIRLALHITKETGILVRTLRDGLHVSDGNLRVERGGEGQRQLRRWGRIAVEPHRQGTQDRHVV